MKFSFIALVGILLLGCSPKTDEPFTTTIHQNWQFKKLKDSVWLTATVPGNVHSDLLEHALILDPFIGNNEQSIQWIAESDWEYRTEFEIDKKTLSKNHIELQFEGLDTYALVYLNDSLILKGNNAFKSYAIDVKSILQRKNFLKIRFQNTASVEEMKKSKLNYSLPEGNRIFTRKAQFQYGWDWGPKLNTSGIWRPVKLVAWNDIKIEDVHIKQKELNEANAKLDIILTLDKEIEHGLIVNVYINNTLHDSFDEEWTNDTMTFPVSISKPKKWWPHNLGEPYLYDIRIELMNNNTLLDSYMLKKGLRTIELVSETDSYGESFYFKVNDVPVYAKGANYIPQNSMQNKVSADHYEKLLSDVVNANMNMLRVWGGGIYENDIFYDLCDEKGILIWQDFMFACAMYPGDDAFLKNIAEEATQNIIRLRDHASLALWCGNNENSEGWHRWGWQDGRSELEKEEIWNNYLKVFDSILPEKVSELSDHIDYWESSPKYGRGNPKYKTEGDAHDWWIWHDGYPFEHFESNVPRFMSEFGFQSFPSYEVINYINQSDSLDISSEPFKNHQKHSRGFQLILDYMARDFPVPDATEDHVYMSQLVQAYGITKGIEAQRRTKPYNMGTLFWQLNDCWPAVSWSSIDFFGNWKALHYKSKSAYANQLISSTIEDNILKTYAINDTLNDIKLELKVQIQDFGGRLIWEDSIQDSVGSISSKLIMTKALDQLNFDKRSSVLSIYSKEKHWLFYFARPKNLKLNQAAITQKIERVENGFVIELSSETLQKDVFLYCNEIGHFSDNYFDLLPNEKRVIKFITESASIQSLRIKSLNNFIR